MKTDQIQAFNENYEKWLQTDNKSCTKLFKLRLFKFYKPKNPLLRFKSTKNQSFDSMQGKMYFLWILKHQKYSVFWILNHVKVSKML